MWIELQSSIASANVSMRACGTSIHDDGPSSRPGRSSATLIPRSVDPDAPGWQRRRTHGQVETAAPAKPARPPTASQATPWPRVLRSAPTSVASSRLEHAADDALDLLRDVAGQLAALRPEDPAQPDQLAEPHQRPRGHLGIERADLAGVDGFRERLDVPLR